MKMKSNDYQKLMMNLFINDTSKWMSLVLIKNKSYNNNEPLIIKIEDDSVNWLSSWKSEYVHR